MSDTKNERFVKAKDKYADMRSSASSLLIIGVLGIIYLVVDYLDILPFSINPNNSWLFTGVMIVLFVIFVVSGLYTLKSAANMKKTIADEDALTSDIKTWMIDNLNADDIDKRCEEKRKSAYDNAVNECINADDAEDIMASSDISTKENAEYETANIDGEEYDLVVFESFYDIPDEMKAFEREEIIIELVQSQFKDATASHISFILEEVYDSIFNA